MGREEKISSRRQDRNTHPKGSQGGFSKCLLVFNWAEQESGVSVNSRNSISRSDAEGTNTRSQRMWELGDLKNLPDDFFFSQHGFYSAVHTCNMSLPPNPTESQKHSLAHVPTAIVLTQTTYWFPQ